MASYPKARKDEVIEAIYGVQVSDPYRWLEHNEDPEVREWLTQQAECAEAYFRGIPAREKLRVRFRQLFSLDTVGVPVPRRGRYFFTERKGDQDMAVLCVQQGLRGTPRVLIDPNTLSEDKTMILKSWAPSRDGRLLIYKLSRAGNDRAAIYVMDVNTGEHLPDFIPDEVYPAVYSPVTWNADGTGFWYTKRDPHVPASEEKLYQRVFFHPLGNDYRDDALIFGEHLDKEDIPWVTLSDDGRFLLANVFGFAESQECGEIYLHDLENPDRGFVPIIQRTPGTKCYGSMHRGKVYILTDHEAPRWHIMTVDIVEASAGKIEPLILIPESEEIIEEYATVGDKLFVASLENVHSMLREYELDGRFVRKIPMPTLGTAGGFSYERGGKECFFSFSSFVTPPSIYRLNLISGKVRVFKKMAVGFNVSELVTEQVWYPSKDRTRIPMFLVYRRGIERNGNNPLVLYGYGGFEVSLTPSFMKNIVPFVERGGMFAIANLRGGGEFGKAWHEAGMRKNKQNVFDDFIAAAEWLMEERYTCRERFAIYGGSNGGLLVTATLTQRPDLMKAAIAAVPVTDMLRYHLFFGGRHWIPDYGDPDDADMVPYLLGYSPYHNVRDGEQYPATLLITSDSDDRVHPMHSYKIAARLQEANASENPILLRVEMKAGHGGANAISKYVEQQAELWGFVFDQLGITV